VALKLDLRAGSFGGARTRRASGGARPLIGQAIFYVLLGVFMALFVSHMGDRFFAASAVFTYVILMVGTAMLVDHNTAIISPTDYGILGFQPISSRTWFASRLTNVLVYTLAMTTALGLLPAGALAVRWGVVVGAAGLVALYACATTVTLAAVALYGTILRRIGARRLRPVLSYVQMFTGFIVYGGYFIISDVLSKSALSAFRLTRSPWLMLYPGSWFASYLEVAAGSASALDVVPVLASIGILLFLATRLRGRLSLDYAERLGALASETSPPALGRRGLSPGFWFRGRESRAVAILVRGHFRSDLRFRMGVLAIVPITVMYLIMGLRSAGRSAGARPGANLSLLTTAVMLFPVLLKLNLGRSDAFRASWIFFATPADRTRLIRSAASVLVAFFVVPYLILVGATLVVFTRDRAHVLVYLLVVGMMSHVALLVATLLDPELPFAKPMERTSGASRIIVTMVVISLMGVVISLVSRIIYASLAMTAVALGLILLVTFALGHLTRLRIERQASHLEFQG